MKTELEIQRAHDILVEIILKRAPNPFEEDAMPFLLANAAVLCWILDHDHNPAFGENLVKIQSWLLNHGYEIQKADKPFTESTHPLGPL